MKKSGISQEGLKLIACLTMLMDHVGASLLPQFGWLRAVGRLAFPIYCFLLVEGVHYTKDPVKYGLRLFIGLLLSELPFDLLFSGQVYWGYQSVMVTLFIAFLMLLVMKKCGAMWQKVLAVIPFCLLAELCMTDYAGAGVLMVALFALTREHPGKLPIQVIGMILVCYAIGGYQVSLGVIRFPLEVLAVFSMIPIALYSGRKATHSKAIQWAFYLFYPVHLTVLWLISLG